MFSRRKKPQSYHSDEELIRQYRATSDPAFAAELYQRYTHLVYGICLKYLKDEEDSKDAVMQLFEKVLQALQNQPVQKFESWLYVLTKNYCLMILRARKTRSGKIVNQDLSELNVAADETSPETALRQEETFILLEEGLNHIPEEQRICIELFYLHKKCYQEIAQITGYDLNKVKSYIQNGKRNLKIYLEKHHE
ncbi:DNA-directed RNA polymerase sigma-70 factor [Adhaeribacter aerolatus]|uniref:DNA-directed RNA polymerase sigma-70 factor n=1 Tax=Adhaeribacter aerolatus TaxID=670289 RepID=A0A512B247_9BACT|nr:sigma-70 family RNA polymerase sigma factor [Adhaeribacter aerolatus]GEO05877.1 DNA-directed RNA polymerase sigma-70 factor [Adhaeribacter aerolatus]